MKIALVTCEARTDGTADDQMVKEALLSLGHQVRFEVWSNQLVDWTQFDLVVIRSTWDYQYRSTEFQKWIQRVSQQTKLLNSAKIIDWNFQKDYLLDLQVPIVPTTLFSSWEEVLAQKHPLKKMSSQLVFKPTISASAELTFLVEAIDTAREMVETILSRSKLMVQPFIPSIKTDGELSLIYFCQNGKPQFSHAILKKPKATDYRVQSQFGGTIEPISPSQKCLRAGEKSLSSLPGDWIYARVDLLDWKTEPLIGELELIEPELFFRTDKESAKRFAKILSTIS